MQTDVLQMVTRESVCRQMCRVSEGLCAVSPSRAAPVPCHRAGSVGVQQVALAVLSLVFLRDRTLDLAVSHQVTPQILALGTGTAVGPHIQQRPRVAQSDPGPGQLCSAVADSAARPSTVRVSS